MEAAEADAVLVQEHTGGKDGSSTGTGQAGAESRTSGCSKIYKIATRNKTRSYRSGRPRDAPFGGGPSGISGAGGRNVRSNDTMAFKFNAIKKQDLCTVCRGNHPSSSCKYRSYVCRVCTRRGHLRVMCQNLRQETTVHNSNHENMSHLDSSNEISDEILRSSQTVWGDNCRNKLSLASGSEARVYSRARPLVYALREPVERALQALVRDGVITPVSSSEWATPIVAVMKKDGTIRVCGDFKLTLNKCLEVYRLPLPRPEDLLAKLYNGKKFTKIDLSQAYAQF